MVESMEKKKSVMGILGIIAVLLVAGAVLAWYFNTFKKVNFCEKLEPGITETEMMVYFGSYTSRKGLHDYTEITYNSDFGPVRARINSNRKVIWLKCSEDGPVNWTTK